MLPFGMRILLALLLPLGAFVMMWAEPGFFFLWAIGWIYSYFFPTVEALIRKSPDTLAIGVLNFFLGWTLVGWVVALVWSVRTSETATPKPSIPYASAKPSLTTTSHPPAYTPMLPDVPKKVVRDTKQCPFCAEEVKAEAIICKHCRSDISQAA